MNNYQAYDLIQIKTPFFTAGLEYKASYINKVRHYKHNCAPIIHYMQNWDILMIIMYCKKRNWEFEILGD